MKHRSYFNKLGPLLLWVLSGALLLALHYHNKYFRQTTVVFRILVNGKPFTLPHSVLINGTPHTSGDRVRLGRKTLEIGGDAVEPFRKKFFVWYGTNDLGVINLALATGGLNVAVGPGPALVQVDGASLQQAHRAELAQFPSLPTGSYHVTALFETFKEERDVQIRRGETTRVEIKPAAGFMHIAADPTNADFKITGGPSLSLEGKTPRLVLVPAGDYQVTVSRRDYSKDLAVNVASGSSNLLTVQFEYAEVSFVTTPAGAQIHEGSKDMGHTPKTLPELKPGDYRFRLELPDYVPVLVDLALKGRESITINTNLVMQSFVTAMQAARNELGRRTPDFRFALQRVEAALAVTPESSAAQGLKRQIESALKEEETRLEEKKRQEELLAAEERSKEQAQAAERSRAAQQELRRKLPEQTFRKATDGIKDSQLFDVHQWPLQLQATLVAAALRRMLQDPAVGWKLESETNVNAEVIVFRCASTKSLLHTTERTAVIVIGQTGPSETHVYAKFWEYMLSKVNISLTSGFGKELNPVHVRFFPADQSGMIEQRRRSVPEDFKTKLLNQLK